MSGAGGTGSEGAGIGICGGITSFLASVSRGHSVSRCCEVRVPPQGQAAGGSFGNGSKGVVPACSLKRARATAGLYLRSSLGKVVDGLIGKRGSGGYVASQSTFRRCWAWAWIQDLVTRAWRQAQGVGSCVPAFASTSALSLLEARG